MTASKKLFPLMLMELPFKYGATEREDDLLLFGFLESFWSQVSPATDSDDESKLRFLKL